MLIMACFSTSVMILRRSDQLLGSCKFLLHAVKSAEHIYGLEGFRYREVGILLRCMLSPGHYNYSKWKCSEEHDRNFRFLAWFGGIKILCWNSNTRLILIGTQFGLSIAQILKILTSFNVAHRYPFREKTNTRFKKMGAHNF